MPEVRECRDNPSLTVLETLGTKSFNLVARVKKQRDCRWSGELLFTLL